MNKVFEMYAEIINKIGLLQTIKYIVIILLCFFITGCGEPKSKEVTTLERFTEVAENNGFVVIDNSERTSKSKSV